MLEKVTWQLVAQNPTENEKPVDSGQLIEPSEEKVVSSETSNPWVLTLTTDGEESKPAAATLP